MSENSERDRERAVERARHFDPERGAFDPPEHPSLRDPETNPSGVRHVDETAQDDMAIADRPRVQAEERRRDRMITAAKRRLRGLSGATKPKT